MPRYRVAVCLEEGIVIEVDAESGDDAQGKALKIADDYAGSRYPQEYNQNRVHRSFFTQDAKEITT